MLYLCSIFVFDFAALQRYTDLDIKFSYFNHKKVKKVSVLGKKPSYKENVYVNESMND